MGGQQADAIKGADMTTLLNAAGAMAAVATHCTQGCDAFSLYRTNGSDSA